MKAYERLIKYAKVYTTSDPESKTVPSAERELDLTRMLADEMKELGISDVHITDKGYLLGVIPASSGLEAKPALGLIAHVDTAPDFSGENVRPRIIENYDGEDIVLGTSGRTISKEQFGYLPDLKGKTLIVTDGTTLLGADDKAGVAEILTACEEVLSKSLPHPKLCIAFTPDEEIGSGAGDLDLKEFGADFAYTVDGGPENEVNFETFNAASAEITINGFNIHPGEAKDRMVNALVLGCELNGMLPNGETPRDTEDHEGFYHLTGFSGTIEKARLSYIIRDHDKGCFEARKCTLKHIVKLLNAKYGEGTVALEIKDGYQNMLEIIRDHFFLVDRADAAMRAAGIEPDHKAVRGGTDGSELSMRGLPCPNLGTGGYAFHGPYEHITVEGMDKVAEVLVNLVGLFAE